MMSLTTGRRSTLVPVDDAQLMAELEPTAVQLYERHMSTAKEWFPHELVPWSRGRDYDADEIWDPDTMKLLRRCAQRAVPQHPHRGQPPPLLPPDQRQVRQRRRVGRVEPPVDGRRGSAHDRDPRLPRGDPLGRHAPLERARMRQVSMGLVPEPRHHRRRHRLHRAAGARHPHLAPQHREAARRPAGRRDHEPGRGRREPAPPLLPRPRVGGARARPVGHGDGDRPPGALVRDARHGHRRLQDARAASSPTPASTTSRRTTTRSSSPSCSSTGASSSCRTSSRRPSRRVERLVRHVEKVGNVARRMQSRLAPRPATA